MNPLGIVSIKQNIRAYKRTKSRLYRWTISKVNVYINNLLNVYNLYTKNLMP